MSGGAPRRRVRGPGSRRLLVPGLGSSPAGQSYSWLDEGLESGVTYNYRLEDVDTSSVSTFHGPVSATPHASSSPSPAGGESGAPTRVPARSARRVRPGFSRILARRRRGSPARDTGHPDAVSLTVVSWSGSGATVDLHTGGFWAVHEASGTVRVFVPGFDTPANPSAPALPVRRALVEAVVGRQVHLVSAEGTDLRRFPGLRPSAVGVAELVASRDGTVRLERRHRALHQAAAAGRLPGQLARLAGTVFQGETKSAVLELTPLRFDPRRQGLVLAGRVRLRLAFAGREPSEAGRGWRGRSLPRRRGAPGDAIAHLHTVERGLHAVRFEELWWHGKTATATSRLSLQRQGRAVPFRAEPATGLFGPGSTLYFFADVAAASTDYTSEVAWELVRGTSGQQMAVTARTPDGAPARTPATGFVSIEMKFTLYQPGLVQAPDIWLWRAMVGGAAQTVALQLAGMDAASASLAELAVHLQAARSRAWWVEHHVQVALRGDGQESPLGGDRFTGKKPHRLGLSVPASLLASGRAELEILNVGDAGVASIVFLDRLTVAYPQVAAARGGVFEGAWAEGGVVEVGNLGPASVVVDVTPSEDDPSGTEPAKWVTGLETSRGGPLPGGAGAAVRRGFAGRAEETADRAAAAIDAARRGEPGGLRGDRTAPVPRRGRAPAPAPREPGALRPRGGLRGHRRGVRARPALGGGDSEIPAQRLPLVEAAVAEIRRPPRGRDRRPPALPEHLVGLAPARPADEDEPPVDRVGPGPGRGERDGPSCPILAVGRLPARTLEEAESLVSKLLAWEDSGQDLDGRIVLVADNADVAGDFEADVEDVARASSRPARQRL